MERDDELARIDRLLGAARAGSGGHLLIAGPAGIGKTLLLAAAAERGRRGRMRVLAARGRELEGGFSFGVARQLFEPLLADALSADREALLAGAAGRAVIPLEGAVGDALAGGSDPSFAVIHGLYWLVVNASGLAPLLVVIDDLHWVDQASMRFVLYMADRLEALPIALFVSWRTGEETEVNAETLERLEQVVGADVLSPAPLSVAGVRDLLVGEFAVEPSDGFVLACHGVTGGNPFLLRELAASLRADGVGPDETAAGRVAQFGPRSIAHAVSLRVGRLGPAAGELARAVAIMGDGTQLRHSAALTGIALQDAAAAADRLADVGIFERGTPLRFVHAIVLAAVYYDLPAAERGLRHAEAARLLAAENADPDEVCAHLLLCEPAGSLEVAERLRAAAARALARGAPENAAPYLRRALEETADQGLRVDLLHELGQTEKLMREPAAIGHLREASELASDPVKRAAIACDRSELLANAGQWDLGVTVIEAARSESADGDAKTRASAAAVRLETLWATFSSFDSNLVANFDRRLGELLASARGRDPTTRPLALLLACILAWRGERTERVLGLVKHGLDGGRLLAELGPDAWHMSHALAALLSIDELDRTSALVDELLAESRAQGAALGLGVGLSFRAAVRARCGELASAETDIRALLELVQEHALAFALPSTLYLCADALIERSELADVAALAAAVELDPELGRTAIGAMLREVQGRLALTDGRPGSAAAELQAAAATYEALRLRNPNAFCWRSVLALALAGEDPGQALRLVNGELQDARRLGFARPVGIALRTRGTLHGGEQGLRDLMEAAEVLEGSYARLEHARALVELGAALRRANQRKAARAPLRSGLDLAHHSGATRLAERARLELRATGAKPRRAVLTGLLALTPSERRVAELAAQGMSNPEIAQALFVTLNTVEGHLRHVYRKLSISSRQELGGVLEPTA
ncbi:MAG: helix-turn-helix transcriptional regulator [Solirubrobacterales bacterium]|nr:helix-turn-helix transcriptional regulator [Solirubrobacterales bacterium]